MTREAREARDFELLPKAKKRRLKEAADGRSDQKKDEEKVEIKPGRKGFINRARVPMPSNQDYVVRPKVRFTFFTWNPTCIFTSVRIWIVIQSLPANVYTGILKSVNIKSSVKMLGINICK